MSARGHARQALLVYALLTTGGFLLLVALGVSVADALVHVLSAISTGGFSSYSDSIGGLGGPAVQWAVMGISLLGAVSLPLYYRVAQHGRAALAGAAEVRGLIAVSLISAVVLALTMRWTTGGSLADLLLHAPLMAVSAQTTTGFANMDPGALAPAAQLVLILSMLIGGSVGSTSGGIKVLRLLIFLRVLQLLLLRTRLPPHAVAEPMLGHERLEDREIERTLLLLVLMGATVVISWLPFLLAGYEPMAALFEVVSALGTVGLSTGIADAALSPGLKAVLCVDMLLGRVEFLALLVVLFPRTWLGRRAD